MEFATKVIICRGISTYFVDFIKNYEYNFLKKDFNENCSKFTLESVGVMIL